MLHCGSLPDIHLRGEGDCQGDQQSPGGEYRQQSRRDPQHSQRVEKSGAYHGAQLCVDPSQITLYLIYSVLEPKGGPSLVEIHFCEGRPCTVA